MTPYDDLLRVTLVARGPGVAAGRVVAEPVSTLDIAATICGAAGLQPGHEMQRRSPGALLSGGAETRETAYSECHVHPSRCGVGLKLRTVRTKQWKCTHLCLPEQRVPVSFKFDRLEANERR